MPDKYKRDISIEVLVGLFMFIILMALGVFTIVLSRQNFLQKKYPVSVVFDEVGGLRKGDHVFLRGTKIGVVKSTDLEDNHVVVTTDTDVFVEFREGYKVEVMASSMLGGKALTIFEGPLNAAVLPEGEVVRGEIPINIIEELSMAVAGLRGVTDKIAAGEGTLGKLIHDEQIYDQMKKVISDMQEVSARIARGEGTLGKLLSEDDHMYDDMQEMVGNLKEVSERLANGESTLGRLLAKDDQLYQDIQKSAASIQEITDKISSGEGTFGRLVEDEQLYAEAEKLLGELRSAIDDMRETSPVTTFSTLLFGAF